MVFRPRDDDETYESLRDRLTGKISGLTNFVTGSFNAVWTRAFSREIRENEIQASASQLSGWIEYAGGPITEDDLRELDMQNVSVEEINQYVDESDLDELVKIVGIDRDEGVRATGEVTFTTVSAKTEIPEGTSVGTQPDSVGNYLEYETTETVESAEGSTEIVAPIKAVEIGERFNVGAQTITYMTNPPGGVQAVINEQTIDGGIDRESNESLRERAREAVFSTSGGGTKEGIIGYIQQNTEATDVDIEEFTEQQPPYADVIVDGGDDTVVQDSIDFAKPVGIQHNLVRPESFSMNVFADVLGSDIDTDSARDDVIFFFDSLQTGDTFYRDKLVQAILNSDEDIVTIDSLTVEVVACTHEYESGKSVYDLRCDNIVEVSEVRGTLNGDTHTFVKGTDYAVTDSNSDGALDSIDWSIGGDSPDDGTTFFVDYVTGQDVAFSGREKAIAGTIEITVA